MKSSHRMSCRRAWVPFLVSLAACAQLTARNAPVPDEAALKQRVDTFYRATAAADFAAALKLMSPGIQRCSTADQLKHDWQAQGEIKFVSWKVREIRPKGAEWGGPLEIDCTHDRVVVDSAAMVVMDVTSQKPDGRQSRDKHHCDGWLYISGEWYWSGGGESCDEA